jgi:flagellar basal-body rod protein FlgF/flagellar basal-body rod protein FlgG
MNSGLYAATAGLIARTEALDVAANNLANASTVGFKAQREFYRALAAELRRPPQSNPLGRAINNFGVLGGANLDFRQGTFERTANELDFALDGPGFFAVQTAAGLRATRNGNFHLDANNRLVTADGDAVLGDSGPLEIPSGPLSVGEDGTLSVRGAVAGQLRIVDADSAAIVQEGKSLFSIPASALRPVTGARVRQGMLESSNMNPVAGAVGLIAIQRQAEMLQRALSIFHNDFNRAAAEDLPRVVG